MAAEDDSGQRRPATVAGPEIAVVCSTYRRPARLRCLVAALEAQTLDPSRYEVVLVDNASGDDTAATLAEMAAASPLCIQALATEGNRGPAPARNLGWRATTAPLLAFVDDDVEPAPGWLEAGLAALAADPGVGVVQGRTTPPPGTDTGSLAPWSLFHDIDGPDHYFAGCNVFYRREAVAEVGGFDEAIGWWGEDTALGWAVQAAGYGRGFAADAVAVHPVEVRPLAWWLRQAWNERQMIGLGRAFPAYRQAAFWRPWAFRRRDALFVLAVVGVVGARWWPPAALLALPYLRDARPPVGRAGWVRLGAETVLLDAARCVGQVAGAVRHRVLVV